jgi:hypothetical protein
MRKRTSPIWQISKQELTALYENSTSFGQILKVFGLVNKGGNNRTLQKRLKEEGLNLDKFQKTNKGRKFPSFKKPILEILVRDSSYCRTHLKKRLLEEKLLPNICSSCSQSPEWNGKSLVLILDHINGTSNDNRLNNLRLLCPNCNSQTETFCGRRKRY